MLLIRHGRCSDSGDLLFLQLGGNSLQAGAVCARLRSTLQLDHPVPIIWLMQSQTIRALAKRMGSTAGSDQPVALPPLTATISGRSDSGSIVAPLTFQQVCEPADSSPSDFPSVSA